MTGMSVEVKGKYERSTQRLQKLAKLNLHKQLEKAGRDGVAALASATPIDSTLTSTSWGYKVTRSKRGYSITWTNSHVVDGTPVAILLQYGHGTGTGGYVKGRNYINPAIHRVFDEIADDVRKAVTSV